MQTGSLSPHSDARRDNAAKCDNTGLHNKVGRDGSAEHDETRHDSIVERSDGDDEWFDNGGVTDGVEFVSRTGIFHILFALFFSRLTIIIFQNLSYQAHHTRFKPFRLFTPFTDDKKTCVLNPLRSRHNVLYYNGRPVSKPTETRAL